MQYDSGVATAQRKHIQIHAYKAGCTARSMQGNMETSICQDKPELEGSEQRLSPFRTTLLHTLNLLTTYNDMCSRCIGRTGDGLAHVYSCHAHKLLEHC